MGLPFGERRGPAGAGADSGRGQGEALAGGSLRDTATPISNPDRRGWQSFDGRPAYFFRIGRSEAIVYADTGEQQDVFPPELNLRTAAAWTGQPASAAKVEEVTEPDQWTLEGGLRNLLPLWKYSWPNGDQVYVSENTGEVVQFTTRSSRLFAELGPIPHWLYYTPLRKNGPLWSKVVIWLSGIATVAALMGLIVGLMMYSPSRRISIPYKGQKRLHHILGLFFGIVACTWAFSGMLSMEPFPLSSGRPQGGRSIAAALRGKRPQLSQYARSLRRRCSLNWARHSQ